MGARGTSGAQIFIPEVKRRGAGVASTTGDLPPKPMFRAACNNQRTKPLAAASGWSKRRDGQVDRPRGNRLTPRPPGSSSTGPGTGRGTGDPRSSQEKGTAADPDGRTAKTIKDHHTGGDFIIETQANRVCRLRPRRPSRSTAQQIAPSRPSGAVTVDGRGGRQHGRPRRTKNVSVKAKVPVDVQGVTTKSGRARRHGRRPGCGAGERSK